MGKINIAKFKKAVEGSGGIKSTIATRLSVTRRGLYQWIEKHPQVNKLITDESEIILDMAENKLQTIIQFGDIKDSTTLGATKYLLATKGKSRGFIEKSEIEHSGGVTEIKVVMANDSNVSPNSETSTSLPVSD